MYKTRGRFVQRLRERGWSIAKTSAPTAKQRSRTKDVTARHRKRPTMGCHTCGKPVERTVAGIQQHYLRVHRRRLTEPEAFRLASTPRKTSYSEGVFKDPREVSGGLPSLGKRR